MMKSKVFRSRNSASQGSAFIVVMGIIGVLMIASISMTQMTGQAAFTVRKLHAGEQARATAEAGIADMIVRMTTNYYYWMNSTISDNYAGGSYTAVAAFDTNTANVVITSTGTYEKESRVAAIELLGSLYDRYNAVLGVDGVIVSGGDCTIDTAAVDISGGIHANGNIYHTKGNTVIGGDVSSCGVVQVDVAAGYQKVPNAAPVVVPTYLPLDPWKDLAQSGGIFWSSNKTYTGENIVPPNGVLYVEGNLKISLNSSMIGTIVASGSVTIENRFSQTPYNTNWPAILAGVDVIEGNLSDCYGVIFAGNNITMTNHRQIKGALIALNNITIQNRVVLSPLNHYPDWTPDDTNSTPPSVMVGGWLK